MHINRSISLTTGTSTTSRHLNGFSASKMPEDERGTTKQTKSSTQELTNTSSRDSGLRSDSFYKSRMSSTRFRIRRALLTLVNKESPALGRLQKKVRAPLLDSYFLYSANLGAHMFYVLMCPLPGWFNCMYLLRDSVMILGLGIFFTGAIKDYLCLPRPKSPPLHRLTLSHYTAKEYGCPSSHTANATSVCLLVASMAISNWSHFSSLTTPLFILLFTAWYFLSLVFGRVYCGMHGCVDLAIGMLVGCFAFAVRVCWLRSAWDDLILNNSSVFVPIGMSLFYYSLIWFHPRPLDPCPCFEDGVSFIGVLIGLDFVHWLFANYFTQYTVPGYHNSTVPFDLSQLGLAKSTLRVILGVVLVVSWKVVSKPALQALCNLFKPRKNDSNLCYACISRTDRDIFIRLIVYAGIPTMVVFGKFIFPLFGLGVN